MFLTRSCSSFWKYMKYVCITDFLWRKWQDSRKQPMKGLAKMTRTCWLKFRSSSPEAASNSSFKLNLGGGFNYLFVFAPYLEKIPHFDEYFFKWVGFKPPTISGEFSCITIIFTWGSSTSSHQLFREYGRRKSIS